MTPEQTVLEVSRRSMERAKNEARRSLRRRLDGLATIGATAPFVGLFGTVVGIVNAFRGTALTKATGLAVVGPGISEALITTSLGLLVAVPAVWAYNFFTAQMEAFDLEMNLSVESIATYLSGVQAARRDH